jgi:Mg-chelatase subunit ChlD
VSFGFPWALLLLLAWLILPREQGWGWRFVASLFLVMALAQPSVTRPGQQLAVLIDVSESVGTRGLEAAQQLELASLGHPVTPYIFAAEVRRIEDPAAVSGAEIRSVRRGETNLATALGVARAQGATRILLIASGIESQGRVLDALPDVPVDIHPVEPLPNARLVKLLAPSSVAPNEQFEVVAVVESDRDTELTLRPLIAGEALGPLRTRITAGRSSLSFTATAPDSGTLPIAASLEVDFEQPTADDSQRIEVGIDEPSRVLVIGDPALSALLEAQGAEVVSGSADDVRAPLDYRAVVVRGSANQFSSGQLELLAQYVRNGGGLLMTGGDGSFGLSGWYRTAVEEVLPVNTELPSDVELPSTATILVIDRSGSMRAERPSRMSLAQRGALDFIDNAHPSDYIGVIAFDHGYEWLFRPRPATERGKREMREAILALAPAGGTIVGPAYQQALDELRQLDAAVKHIILLSDGEFFDGTGMQGPASMGPRPDFEGMAAEGLADGITTTTIGIGEADFGVLERMAQAGGGRFYPVTQTRDLPDVFVAELIVTSRTVLRNEPFAPRLHPHPLTLALADPPSISAYIASTLKEGSELLLEGFMGEPVLAISRQGLGRSAALTTDLNRWASEWGTWSGFGELMGRLVRWLQAAPEPYSVTLSSEGSRLRVVVDAVRDGEYLTGERLEARYGGARTPLEQTGPGRYEALLEEPPRGGSVVVQRGDGELIARAPVTVPPAALDPHGAEARLEQIAERTDGQLVVAESRYDSGFAAVRASLWPYLAIIGLVLFVLELFSRRFGTPRPRPRGAATPSN